MTLILRVPGISFSNTAIPLLYNDVVANAGTLDIFDALDADVSWPSQGDPSEGSDTWKSLLTANTASFAGTVGWSDGFTIDATPDVITMPSTFKFGASADGIVIFWLKVGTQAFTSGTNNYVARVGNLGTNQWVCFMNYAASEASTFLGVYSSNNAAVIGQKAISAMAASRVLQVAISMELVGGVYVEKLFFDGALAGTSTTALATLPQPSGQMFFGGSTNAFTGTVLRAVADDLSVTTPEALAALDYATHVARLTA